MTHEAPATRSASLNARPAWHGRIAVVSPHLDDAVLSLGASIRGATRRRAGVDIITVLAGDPASTAPADASGRRAGFATLGQAAERRRHEDREACRLVGARPVWLGFGDGVGMKASPADLRQALPAALAGYHTVLTPGSPLTNADHRLVSRAVIEVLEPGVVLGLYREQPYASWDTYTFDHRPRVGPSPARALATLGLTVNGQATWQRRCGGPVEWVAKTRAMSAYVSQMPVLRTGPRTRILLYELLHRGEAVVWATMV